MKNTEIKRTSAEWLELANEKTGLIIISQAGWDKKNYKSSFYAPTISRNEFLSRVSKSAIIVNNVETLFSDQW